MVSLAKTVWLLTTTGILTSSACVFLTVGVITEKNGLLPVWLVGCWHLQSLVNYVWCLVIFTGEQGDSSSIFKHWFGVSDSASDLGNPRLFGDCCFYNRISCLLWPYISQANWDVQLQVKSQEFQHNCSRGFEPKACICLLYICLNLSNCFQWVYFLYFKLFIACLNVMTLFSLSPHRVRFLLFFRSTSQVSFKVISTTNICRSWSILSN